MLNVVALPTPIAAVLLLLGTHLSSLGRHSHTITTATVRLQLPQLSQLSMRM